jgi:hypothetical protein
MAAWENKMEQKKEQSERRKNWNSLSKTHILPFCRLYFGPSSLRPPFGCLPFPDADRSLSRR